MRPLKLEVSGFGAFRDRTEIAFDDADYFTLVGPTGAGKSTVIDAICFALYGSVPRYDNENLVAPVISLGQLEAKVRLDFTLGDETFTAVRVVRRTPTGGATTKEARLERGEDSLASSADEVSREIRRLVGLSFDQFTKSVVLPQGEFARFLHDKRAQRQDLLIRLLNLDVYGRMQHSANQRAAEMKAAIALDEQRLAEDLAFATDDALEKARARATRITALAKRVEEATPQLQDLDKKIEEAEATAGKAATWVEALEEIEAPDDIGELARTVKDAQATSKKADKALQAARKNVEAVTKALADLPKPDPLKKALEAHSRLADLAKEQQMTKNELGEAKKADEQATGIVRQAEDTLGKARERLKGLNAEHAAHALASGLKKGAPCPVCDQPVTTLPKRKAPSSIAAAEKEVSKGEAALAKARLKSTAAGNAVAATERALKGLEKETGVARKATVAHPDRRAIERSLAAIAKAEANLKVAQEIERDAYDAREEAAKILEEAMAEAHEARAELQEAREALIPLEPPRLDGTDIALDWKTLTAWAKQQITAQRKAQAAANRSVQSSEQARDKLRAQLRTACEECEIDLADRDVREAVAVAQERADTNVKRIDTTLEQAAKLRKKIDQVRDQHALMSELARHLSALNFERWLVDEAVRRLLVGASQILDELSGGRFALDVDAQSNFIVIDQHNAGERRPARTLSGGETFLASLALALALADHMAELAAKGAARLDAIFLDEGFSTLDPETLDTVAATIENLAAGGRMVGIITHVRELAERVPVRFVVRKTTGGSSVHKEVA